MSTKPDDGGLAFQRPGYGGMSLRDWFAGQALAGIQAAERDDYAFGSRFGECAERAYKLADAMLAARKGDQP